jgi:transposase
LDTFWPGPLDLFKDLFSKISLRFLQAYPTPQSAEGLTEKRLAAFLKRNRYSGHQPAAKVLQRLREAPAGHAGTAEAEAKGTLVRTMAHLLEELGEQIGKLDSTIEEAIASIPDGRIVTSFPRAGRINAAQILAELGDVRERYQSDQHLAAEAGVCPVTYQSGRSRGVACRWACNKRLRAAVVIWADNSRHSSPWANDVYRRARSRGCAHAHAVRILARAWIRVLWRSWTDRTPYDPARHRAAQKFAA